MSGIFSLAYITFKEGIRNRALFGIFIMALVAFTLTVTLTDLFMRDIVRVAASLSLSTISFSGLLMVVFIGTNLLSKDIDKRTIYMVISRPISRAQYIVGKFVGLCFLVVASILFLGLVSSLPVYFVGLSYQNPNSIFNWSGYGIAILLIAMKLMLMAAVIIFFSSITSSSFISMILTIATYIIGSTNEVVKGLLDAKMEGVEITPLMGGVIKFVYYVFPNLSAFDIKVQAVNGLAIPPGYVLWTAVYWLFYTGIAVTAGSLLMSRREFP
jgi:ABC-type transport system involved in multi-copper enzyme maturation permease subunit